MSSTTPSNAPSSKAATVTPQDDPSLRRRMKVEKQVVDELLLVCGVIGTTVETDETGMERLVPVTDCLNWLQDLQRALRRDDDLYRPISILLGTWKVVQQKLLPLVISCQYDTAMVLTVCKILVILTKPLAENTVRAGKMVIDTKKHSEMVVKEQISLRQNALDQAETLMEYKRAICHHNSHNKDKSAGGVLSVFVSLLAEPLSKTGSARTENDHLTIELVLHLFRNLLCAEPLLNASTEAAQRAVALHCELVSLLERELVLEILLVLGAGAEQRENQPYNLLLMELLHNLIRHQDPTMVARSGPRELNATTIRPPKQSRGLLKGQIEREKQQKAALATSRHSHFGGTLVLDLGGGRQTYMSAARIGQGRATSTAKRRKKAEAFVGAASTVQSHRRRGGDRSGPAQQRAQQTLNTFCERFVEECYGPVMKSLKNEFRRDSVRLEETDRVIFFRLVWFFCKWWRVSGKKNSTPPSDPTSGNSLGQLIFTMDVFTFNMVLNAIDSFTEHKKHARLAQSVAVLSEMLHLLQIMHSAPEPTEQVMAMGLLDRLYYGSEPLDRLPKLLSQWKEGTSTREYLCDLVEVCHMTLKLLEANAKVCSDMAVDKKRKKELRHDTIGKMKATAAEFDVSGYVVRRIVSNQTVSMFTHLLSQYAINSPHVNHRIVALFLRLSKIKVAVSEEADPELPQNLLAAKTATLEPMLYNIQLFRVLNTILSDKTIRKDADYTTLLSFCQRLVRNFSVAAQSNPMLFVEALFKHPSPHRFCEHTTNLYVNEELRMIAERELLLEEQRRYEREGIEPPRRGEVADEESEDEELEFEDYGVTGSSAPLLNTATNKSTSTGTERANDEDSDDERGDEVESRLSSIARKQAKSRLDLKRRRDVEASKSDSSDDEDVDFGTMAPTLKRNRAIVDDDDED